MAGRSTWGVLLPLMMVSSLLLAAPAAGQARPSDAELRRELRGTRAVEGRNGHVRLLGGTRGRPLPRPEGVAATAGDERVARGFLDRYGPLFGVDDQAKQLRVGKRRQARNGRQVVRFQQVRNGVPVMAGEINVQVGEDGSVLVANGEASTTDVSTTAKVAAASARRTALTVTSRQHGLDAASLQTTEPQLWIYDPALLGVPTVQGSRLVWRAEVTPKGPHPVRELVLVDAVSGGVVLHFNQIPDARSRYVCDRRNVTGASDRCTGSYAATEASPPNTKDATETRHAFNHAGTVYDYLRRSFNRDSLDDRGLALRQVVRFCPSGTTCSSSRPYPNAFWNGTNMVYGDGFARADDVVAHELAHGMTQYESNLFYYYQSGAINESMSDVFGELIDLSKDHGSHDDDSAAARWYLGEDVPPLFGPSPYRGAARSLKDPTLFDAPDRMGSGNYQSLRPSDPAFDNGGVHTNSGVANKAAYLLAETAGTSRTFNQVHVTAIGPAKTAQLFYEANSNLLTSGSDYADLGAALQQACYSLTGVGGISTGNCGEVADAVAATEMFKQPTDPLAQAPDVPACDTGTPKDAYLESVPSAAGVADWSIVSPVGTSAWQLVRDYVASSPLAFYGRDLPSRSDSSILMGAGVTVPVGAQMHFRHAFETEAYADTTYGYAAYDGGVVQYSINGGSWLDARPLFTDGSGYNVALDPHGVSDNPLGGGNTSGTPNRWVFGGFSSGWMSSRLDLSSLAGQNVRFRFRMGSDTGVGNLGWLVDDIRIYTCVGGADAAVTTAGDSPDPVKVGMEQSISATIANRGPDPASATQLKFFLTANQAFLGGPAGCRHSGGTALNGGRAGGTVSCTTGTLAVGGTATRAITVGAIGAGTLRTRVAAVTSAPDRDRSNNLRYLSTKATYPTGQTTRCTTVGTSAGNTINGTSGVNTLCGFGGNDSIQGAAGNDTVNGGAGNDKLFGQDGNDKLFGLTGKDSFNGGPGTDRCPDRVAGEPKTSCP